MKGIAKENRENAYGVLLPLKAATEESVKKDTPLLVVRHIAVHADTLTSGTCFGQSRSDNAAAHSSAEDHVMGNFYTNYTLKGASQQVVADAMAGNKAFVTPSLNDAVVVFDAASDKQDTNAINRLGAYLCSRLHCPVLAVLNHDDDILWYQLHTPGQPVDEYNSSPDYFDFDGRGEPRGPTGGDAAKLCQAFGAGDAARVEDILRKSGLDDEGYVFAFQRHADLFEALNLPAFAVGTGYQYLTSGEFPEGLSSADIIQTK